VFYLPDWWYICKKGDKMQIIRMASVLIAVQIFTLPALSQSITNITPEPPPYLFEPPVVEFKGGDGSSVSNAVIIVGAISTALGINAERYWVREHYGYSRLQMQSLVEDHGRQFDVNIYRRGTNTFTVAFDITDFFGKSHLGEWQCAFDDGSSATGTFFFADQTPWVPLTSNRSATVHYQIEEDCNNGLVVVAQYKNGKINGLSKAWMKTDGIYLSEFKDGILNGYDYSWYTNGTPRVEQYFTNGIRTGSYRHWHKNGQIGSEGEVRNGKPIYRDGQKMWHENGAVDSQYFRLSGTNYWLIARYYPDGKPKSVEYERDGNRCGPSIELYENGLPHRLNMREGKYTSSMFMKWYENGQKSQIEFNVTNNTGVFRSWSTNGTLVAEGFSREHEPWSGTFYRRWGREKGRIIHYKDGEKLSDGVESQNK
jgi:antitoxin component YwqK of YwqJK toxin-antitoxin module